ncbi:hypothetical protein CFIO01_07425 [Colletotrichum fioriniae PJ7]|uniref:Uncharacterized protein n=1 Tax=Colletotrichum fioriniae PJ7 TaxID=1445577 RepID=A0A010RS55_9PEZI|nr:hypothetical protein CFIO01_07425 [Colletotrichum fioriniae PJ7]
MATTPPIDDQSERYLVAISRIALPRKTNDELPSALSYLTSREPDHRSRSHQRLSADLGGQRCSRGSVKSMSKEDASHLLGRLNANLQLGFGFVDGRFDETLPRH